MNLAIIGATGNVGRKTIEVLEKSNLKINKINKILLSNLLEDLNDLELLLDQKQFLPYFPMLKDREKRIEQDNIWKQICDELEWEYIPTI